MATTDGTTPPTPPATYTASLTVGKDDDASLKAEKLRLQASLDALQAQGMVNMISTFVGGAKSAGVPT